MGTPLGQETNTPRVSAGAAGLTLILGLWYIASPWIYGYANGNTASVWNSVIVGILIALFAATRLSNRGAMPAARWLDLLLGIWAFFSPWIFGYVRAEPRFINSLCVGVLVFVLSLWGTGTTRPGVVRMH